MAREWPVAGRTSASGCEFGVWGVRWRPVCLALLPLPSWSSSVVESSTGSSPSQALPHCGLLGLCGAFLS